jgi:hypothetical protein
MGNRSNKKRLDDLDRETGGGDETKIVVNWESPGMVLDEETKEYVTEAEWKKRHLGAKLKVVTWDWDED